MPPPVGVTMGGSPGAQIALAGDLRSLHAGAEETVLMEVYVLTAAFDPTVRAFSRNIRSAAMTR
jgi:hypothetical protein